MDRGTNGTPGAESKGDRQKLHLGPPYKTYMSSPGPGLWLERPKARGTFIHKPVIKDSSSSLTRRSNEEKCFSPRVINFFEVGYWQGKTHG
jgi:hypothetical protein